MRGIVAGVVLAVVMAAAAAAAAQEPPPRLEGEWITLELRERAQPPTVADVFLVRPDGSGLVDLTNGAALDGGPELSPDGTAIAVGSYVPGAGPTRVVLMDVDGANRRPLGVDGGRDPTWTPDGRSIVYATSDSVRMMDRNGAGDHAIVTLPGDNPRVAGPRVSPDGSTVAFAAQSAAPQSEVFVVPIGGGAATQLTTEHAMEPDWSPDGTLIVFTSFRPGPSGNFWVMAPDGTDQRHAFESPSNDFHGSWSPDGSRVVFEAVRDEGFAITVHDLATGTTTDLLATTSAEPATYRAPTWHSVTVAPVCDAEPDLCVLAGAVDADTDGYPGTTATTVTTAAVATTAAPVGTTAPAGADAAPPASGSSSNALVVALLAAILLALVAGVVVLARGRPGGWDRPPPPPPPLPPPPPPPG